MSYDLIEKEGQYLSELKETTMIKHVGSGPKDPAPEEKDAKSPVDDSKGEGTQQAGTKDPNKIPPVSKLGKELAKEDMSLVEELEWALENCGKDHSKDKKMMKEEQAKPDFLDVDKDNDEEEPMKKALKDKEKEEGEEEVKEQDEMDAAGDIPEKELKDEKEAEGAEAEAEMAEEQMSIKNQARMAGRMDNPPPVPGSPAEKEARRAANAQPAVIQKMRRPIPPPRPVRMGRL